MLSREVSGRSGGEKPGTSEIGVSAALHGRDLLQQGFTLDQVVHDYGDLCQAVTELAFEDGAAIQVDEFRTLNRCLDNAIADVRVTAGVPARRQLILLAEFVAEVTISASLEARARDCKFTVHDIEKGLAVDADRAMLFSAVGNLSICRRSVEANGGMLRVRDVPGKGCVFTIDLPRHLLT